ncbi:hypothetical protein LEM8419_00584 [Neolewinella maritima]|uniref:Biopolymer transporter ExbD n=2 Tax=Neolewinella maritima TaxID=1383882 RepID=A0ABM9AYA8_9BACT|nr:hypothetical protein LEM8419_00584 [Neolewinella maritima]
MADIAFLLLIFFLVTTTIAEEQGVLVRLPAWEIDAPITPSSEVFTVMLNANDELLVEEVAARSVDLPQAVYDFVLSPQRTPKQAVISLVHDRSSSYARYLEVYDALLAGYHMLWDESANRQYGKRYAMLTELQQKSIRAELPMTLSEAEPIDALKAD